MSTLRSLREQQGKTQEDIAQAIGVTRSYVTQLELGIRQGTPQTLRKLAKVFGVSMESLLDDSIPVSTRQDHAVAAK